MLGLLIVKKAPPNFMTSSAICLPTALGLSNWLVGVGVWRGRQLGLGSLRLCCQLWVSCGSAGGWLVPDGFTHLRNSAKVAEQQDFSLHMVFHPQGASLGSYRRYHDPSIPMLDCTLYSLLRPGSKVTKLHLTKFSCSKQVTEPVQIQMEGK